MTGTVEAGERGPLPVTGTVEADERGALPVTGTVEADEDYSSSWWADDAVSDADPLPVTQAVAEAPWPYAPQPVHLARRGRAAQPASTAARPARRSARQSRAGTEPRTRVRGWRWVTTISVLTVVVLGIVGIAADQIVARLRSAGHASASTVGATPTVQPAAVKGMPTGPAPSSLASATPAATKSAAVTPSEPKATPGPPAAQLTVQEASAFGPDGLADGDNPQAAGYVIDPNAPLPWHTDWYMTAEFGQLKYGTGLLLDMGQTVTVTSVRIRLDDISGADLQVRAGAVASLDAAPVLASAQDAGGALTLQLKAPARARYVIIWFTGLPPDGAGKYQASVYSIAVTGRP
jgi:hypothetical protein